MRTLITILMLLCFTATAFAADFISPIIPKPTKSTCVSMIKGRATQATVTMGTSTAINWQVYATPTVASPGTATVVKKKFGANTAYMSASSGSNEKVSTTAKTAVFERYSSDTTLNLCYELN